MFYPSIMLLVSKRKFFAASHTHFVMLIVWRLGRLIKATSDWRLLRGLICVVYIITAIDWIMHCYGLYLLIIDCTIDGIILFFISDDAGDWDTAASNSRLTTLIALLTIVLWLNWFVYWVMQILISLFSQHLQRVWHK